MGVKTLSNGLKTCSKCNEEKALEHFQRYGGYHMSWCTTCKSMKAKKEWNKQKHYKWWKDDIDG